MSRPASIEIDASRPPAPATFAGHDELERDVALAIAWLIERGYVTHAGERDGSPILDTTIAGERWSQVR